VGNARDFHADFSGCGLRGVFIDGGDDDIHAFLDLADLRMHFLNEVMFQLREFFDAFALFLEPGQELVLVEGDPAHPPKAKAPTNHARQGHPEIEQVDVHGRAVAEFCRGAKRDLVKVLMDRVFKGYTSLVGMFLVQAQHYLGLAGDTLPFIAGEPAPFLSQLALEDVQVAFDSEFGHKMGGLGGRN
jgi:hypothetical protein